MIYPRQIEPDLRKSLFKGDIVVIYGARQVGKTTLVKKIANDFPERKSKYFNLDNENELTLFENATNKDSLKDVLEDFELVIIDEAQRCSNIGLKLKIIADNFPAQQIIATGSSSFDLNEKLSEPLTGRSVDFWLYPLSLKELKTVDPNLNDLLIYGSYPAVINAQTVSGKKLAINKIAQKYLYKDVLKFQNLKANAIVKKLLAALAFQVGNEVSYTELANLVGINKETVVNYIDILEKAFIIFSLGPFSRNLRNELGKLHKIYFYDLGIRNSLINNLNPVTLRDDIGKLWENFVICEKKKLENWTGNPLSLYFWRTYDQQEIDLVEEKNGQLYGYEIKWTKTKKNAPKAWRDGYPKAFWQTITKADYRDFFLKY